MTDTNLLRKKIEESGIKLSFIAEKLGMTRADDVMQYNHIEWTEFVVE